MFEKLFLIRMAGPLIPKYREIKIKLHYTVQE